VFRGVREEGTKDGELAERSHHEERTVNRRSGPERNPTIEATIIEVKRITWIGGIVSSWRRQRGSANQSHGYRERRDCADYQGLTARAPLRGSSESIERTHGCSSQADHDGWKTLTGQAVTDGAFGSTKRTHDCS